MHDDLGRVVERVYHSTYLQSPVGFFAPAPHSLLGADNISQAED